MLLLTHTIDVLSQKVTDWEDYNESTTE